VSWRCTSSTRIVLLQYLCKSSILQSFYIAVLLADTALCLQAR
jgi:hypothetical protein